MVAGDTGCGVGEKTKKTDEANTGGTDKSTLLIMSKTLFSARRGDVKGRTCTW